MSGSEIDIRRNIDTPHVKLVEIDGSLSTAHLAGANDHTSIHKINLQRAEPAAPPAVAPPDAMRVVPMEGLDLLVDPSKTKSESLPSSMSAAAVAPAAAAGSQPESVEAFLKETTDLSDILDKSANMGDLHLQPQFNVSTQSQVQPSCSPSIPADSTVTNNGSEPPAPTSGIFASWFGTGNDPAATPTAGTAVGAAAGTAVGAAAGTAAGAAAGTAAGTAMGARAGSSVAAPPLVPERPKTVAEQQREKQDLLFRLNRLRARGMPVTQKYTMSSNLDDVRDEFDSLKYQRDVQNSIKLQRKIMMAVITGVEFLNSKFDPFDVRLDGWSESVHENISDYDEVFEELHDKYKEKAKMAPETKLLFSICGSAFMFHLTQSLFKTMPAMGDVLQQNPQLMNQFAQATVSAAAQQNQMPVPQTRQTRDAAAAAAAAAAKSSGESNSFNIGSMLGNFMGMGGGDSESQSDHSSAGSIGGGSAARNRRPEMHGPSNMDDILASLANNVATSTVSTSATNRIQKVSTADEADINTHSHTMQNMQAASSGYRRRVSDGMRLNI